MEQPPMDDHLKKTMEQIGEDFRQAISEDSRHYCEVSIGQRAERLGYPDLKQQFQDVYAIVPLKRPAGGMKVRIDGRTFVNYAQFDSGVVVPGYIAQRAGLPCKPYRAQDSMILNFA
jgi:hypothetical protein